jgi:putative copper export protein/methionine-rich copper-binding protein CopC
MLTLIRRALPAFAAVLATLLVATAPASADAGSPATSPAANAALQQSPSEVVLHPDGPVDIGAARVTVYDAGHQPVATAGPVEHRAGALVSPLPGKLKDGVYTVVWTAPGATGAQTGSFAFTVGGSPALVQNEKPDDQLTPAVEAIPRWLAFAFIMIFIGALALRLLVTAPAAAQLSSDEQAAVGGTSDRRLLVLAGASILLFIPATLAQLVNETADEDAGRSFWQNIRPGDIGDALTGTPDGHLWLARLILTALAALVVVPAAVVALRRGPALASRTVSRVMLLGFALGTAELIARVIPTKAPPAWPREIFTDLLDWGHMFAASVWVGGLVGLALLGVALRVPAEQRGRFWPLALKRFSLVATICVGAMILTGLWTAWIHVGPPRLLFHTLYGETLLVKLILVLILVGLGGINQMWLLPRVNALRERGGEGSALSLALRHFRVVVAFEALLGILILLVVPFLSGSARNQAFQDKAADLTQTAQVAGQSVRLRPSGLQPGVTDYDVSVPGADGGPVTVAFASPKLGVPATAVAATSLGGDRYRVSGLYTPMAGAWQVQVAAARQPPATFALDVTTEPAEAEKAPAPTIQGSTWAWGIGELLVVLIALGGAGVASSRLTRRRTHQLAREALEPAEGGDRVATPAS